MSKDKAPQVSIRGKVVTPQQIAAYGKQFAAQSEAITVWANYCAIHAIAHGNTNPINTMFDNDAFRLKSGKLSKLGGEVLAYIKDHAPLVQFDSETGRVRVAKVKESNPVWRKFQNPVELKDDKPAIVEPGDFALTFDEWRQVEKPEKEPATPKLKAATVANQLDKALENIKAGTFVASEAEAAELYLKLKTLFGEVDKLHNKLAGIEEKPDADKVAELLKSGQAGKSARAGGKVETA